MQLSDWINQPIPVISLNLNLTHIKSFMTEAPII